MDEEHEEEKEKLRDKAKEEGRTNISKLFCGLFKEAGSIKDHIAKNDSATVE